MERSMNEAAAVGGARTGTIGWLGVVLAASALLFGCRDDSTYHGPGASGGLIGAAAQSFDLGEALYKAYHARLEGARARALEARKAEFIGALDTVLTPGSLQGLGPTLQGVLALIDDGTLPRFTDDLAGVLQELADEPGRPTLRALLELMRAPRVVQGRDALRLAGQVVAFEEFDRFARALAALVRRNDGRPNGERDLVSAVLRASSLLAARLARAGMAPTSGSSAALPVLTDRLLDALLVTPGPSAAASFGAPAWVVLADRHGNPAVRPDPASGALPAPFIDRDGDGAADVDAQGRPVDAGGRPIAIAAFGLPGQPGYDAYGRALTSNGALYYRYIDAKRTTLGHLLRLLARAIERGVAAQAFEVAAVSLGRARLDDNGTADPADDFERFEDDNPLHALAWGALELGRLEHNAAAWRAFSHLLHTDPALGERLLVELGRAIERLRPVALAPRSPQEIARSRAFIDRLLLVFDRLMQTGGGGRRSTGRIVFEAAASLGQSGRAFGRELALMLRYRKLVLDANGQPAAGSEQVDHNLPATAGDPARGVQENRSVLQQVLDLLVHADRCRLFGRPLAEVVLELMAGRSVGTVDTLIALTGNGVARTLADAMCPGIGADLDGLEGLRRSGALDALLPLARAFVERGETRLLVDLLSVLAVDYETVVRPFEPALADVLEAGVMEPIFDLLERLAGVGNAPPVRDPLTGERVLDLLADALAELVRHPANGVADRWGRRHPSPLHLVIDPVRRIEDALLAAQGGHALGTALIYGVSDLMTERSWFDPGTPGDPSDDYEVLADPNVMPLLMHVVDTVAEQVPASVSERAQAIDSLQAALAAIIRAPELVVWFEVGRLVLDAPGKAVFEQALLRLLRPDPSGIEDAHGALLQLAVSVLQRHVDVRPLGALSAFLARSLEPGHGRAARMVHAALELYAADDGALFVGLARNALLPAPPGAPLAQGAIPLEVLLDVLEDVERAGGGVTSGSGAVATSEIERVAEALREIAAFLRDDPDGLKRVYRWVRDR